MWRFIFSIVILTFGLKLLGQDSAPKKEKKSADLRPYELKIGINAIRSIRTPLTTDLTTHELELALGVHKYNLIFDYGIEERVRGESFDYQNRGSYFRAGFDRNFSKDKSSGNVLSLGLRYGRANFEDELVFTTDQGFGEQIYRRQNENLTARWIEVAFGLRGKVVSNFYMGFTMRWQFARNINGEGELKTFDIPGFGKTRRQNSTAFDYYLMWRIPFRKDS